MADPLPRPCRICRRVLVYGTWRCAAGSAARGQVVARLKPKRPTQRMYSTAWRKARAGFLRKHPFCATCLTAGREVRATELDHVVPHDGDFDRFWTRDNWQPLCKPCHSRKTLAETKARRPSRFQRENTA